MPGELARKRPARLDVQRAVDRLVRDPHLLIVGVRESEPARDLLRRASCPSPSITSSCNSGQTSSFVARGRRARSHAAARPRARDSVDGRGNGSSRGRSCLRATQDTTDRAGRFSSSYPREISSRSAEVRQHSARRRGLGRIPPIRCRYFLIVCFGIPSRRPISASPTPSARSTEIPSFTASTNSDPSASPHLTSFVSEPPTLSGGVRQPETADESGSAGSCCSAWKAEPVDSGGSLRLPVGLSRSLV